MNGPATAFCGVANRAIKEKWGFPTASAPSNGSYMDLNRFKEKWGFKGWSATDAALEALSAFLYHDMIFSGPMAGATRILPAVAEADAFLATTMFAQTKQFPRIPIIPFSNCFRILLNSSKLWPVNAHYGGLAVTQASAHLWFDRSAD